MNPVATSLQKAVFQALHADSTLIGLLGAPHVFDQVPEKVDPPYVVHGTTRSTDWSTSTEPGEVIEFTLHTWSNTTSREQSFAIQDRIKSLLADDGFSIQDHYLVNLRLMFCETSRDQKSTYLHGVMRFRVVTEPSN